MNGIQKLIERLASPEPTAIANTAREARASSALPDPCVVMVALLPSRRCASPGVEVTPHDRERYRPASSPTGRTRFENTSRTRSAVFRSNSSPRSSRAPAQVRE